MSMRTETLALVISGDGKQLGAELGKSESRLKAFSGKAGAAFAGIGKKFSGALGKLANPLVLLGGTAGIVMAARDMAEYQDSISTLGISAGLSAEQMMALEKRIQSAAYTTGQGREKLVAAVKEMADLTGDNDFASAALEDVGRAATAVSADITTTAQAFAAFRRDMGATNEEAAGLFNTMASMGNIRSMDRFARSARVLGLTKENFAEYNAVLKTIAPTMGGIDGAANAVDNIAAKVKDSATLQRRIGPDIFDGDGAIKDYKTFFERVSKMNARWRKKMFGNNASAAFRPFEPGADGFNQLDDYMRKAEQAEYVTAGFAKKQQESKYQFNMLATAAKEFAGVALRPLLEELTEGLRKLTSDPAALESFRQSLEGIASALGAVGKVVGWVGKGIKGYQDFMGGIAETIYGVSDKQINKATFDKIPRALRYQLERKYNVFTEERWGLTGKYRAVDREKSHKAVSDAYQRDFMTRPQAEQARRLAELTRENDAEKRSAERPTEIKNTIPINVTITEGGRATVETPAPNTSATINVNRGRF